MSDIAIEFRIKNGRLKRAIQAKGWASYAEFCRRHQIAYVHLAGLLSMRKRACGRDGWRAVAVDIATALHCEPEDLWPNEMATVELRTNSGEFAVSMEEAAQLSTPHINRMALAELTKVLRPNELKAVTAIACGQTLDDGGKGLGWAGGDLSRERVRQLAAKAVRRMAKAARDKGVTFSDVVEAPA